MLCGCCVTYFCAHCSHYFDQCFLSLRRVVLLALTILIKVPFCCGINHCHYLHHLFVRVRHFRQQLSSEYQAIALAIVLTILLSVFFRLSSYVVLVDW